MDSIDDNSKVAPVTIVGKGENASYQHFLLPRLFSLRDVKTRDCLGKGYLLSEDKISDPLKTLKGKGENAVK